MASKIGNRSLMRRLGELLRVEDVKIAPARLDVDDVKATMDISSVAFPSVSVRLSGIYYEAGIGTFVPAPTTIGAVPVGTVVVIPEDTTQDRYVEQLEWQLSDDAIAGSPAIGYAIILRDMRDMTQLGYRVVDVRFWERADASNPWVRAGALSGTSGDTSLDQIFIINKSWSGLIPTGFRLEVSVFIASGTFTAAAELFVRALTANMGAPGDMPPGDPTGLT